MGFTYSNSIILSKGQNNAQIRQNIESIFSIKYLLYIYTIQLYTNSKLSGAKDIYSNSVKIALAF